MLAKAKYRKDYKQPDFTVTDIYLDFQLDPKHTVVTATTKFQRLNDEATSLRLDGHSFQFSSIKFNGEPFSAYQQDGESLTLDLKGKSALMMFDKHANLKYKFGNRHFWAEGYYVSTVGLNEATIKKYIQEQEKYDIALDKLSVKEYEYPFRDSGK